MSRKAPRISIITPSFNQAQYLEDTIKSVLDQGYPDLEYILIDGGSTDGSVQIVEKYAGRLAYWASEKDRGQAHAINKGLRRCTGDIIAWLNSDDLYTPGALAWVADFFSEHGDVDFLYGDAEIVDRSGNFVMHRKELPVDRSMGDLIGWGLLIPQPAAFWRRNVLEKVGLLDESLRYVMDAEYWLRVSRACKMQHVDRLFARQRYHPAAKTAQVFQEDRRAREELEHLLRQSYNHLSISRFIPYRYAPLLRKAYRLKRIFLRLVRGHYFKGYSPDWVMRNKQF